VQQVHTSSTNGTETLDTFIQVTTPAKTLISSHRPYACDPTARRLGDLAWGNRCVAGQREGGASHVRGWRQLDDDGARASSEEQAV
jgi:hypothetical protein